jgi:hypothetical protein
MLLSQYVEVHHTLRLMEEFAGGVGYLLKDRVSELGAFATECAAWRRATSSSTQNSSPGSCDAAGSATPAMLCPSVSVTYSPSWREG